MARFEGRAYHGVEVRRRNPARRWLATALGVALSLGAVAPTVHAAPAAPEDFESESARALYEAGIADFNDGDYEGALAELDASLDIEVQARTLYAKAQSLNKLERCREAVPIYNRVLELLPADSPAQPAVKDALVICAEQMAAEDAAAASEPVVEPTPNEDEEPRRKRKRGNGNAWYKDPYAPVMLGLGAVGVGVGGYFLAEAAKLDPDAAGTYGGFEVERDRQRDLQIRGGIITGVGGALVLGGVIRYIVVATRNRGRAPSGQARVSLDAVGTLRVRF